jgi:hypothetical protein
MRVGCLCAVVLATVHSVVARAAMYLSKPGGGVGQVCGIRLGGGDVGWGLARGVLGTVVLVGG